MNSGQFSGKFSSSKPNMQLAMYDDQKISWEEVYGSSMSCNEKKKHARWLSPPVQPGQTTDIQVAVSEHIHPRWWFVVALNCPQHGSPGRTALNYHIEFTNNGGYFSNQYSWNEQGLCQMYLSCFVVAAVGLGLHIRSLEKLRTNTGKIHPIVR